MLQLLILWYSINGLVGECISQHESPKVIAKNKWLSVQVSEAKKSDFFWHDREDTGANFMVFEGSEPTSKGGALI